MSQGAETLLPINEPKASPANQALAGHPDAAISRGRVDSLDGVRALAVFAVMMLHAGFPGSELGWLGVDMFFVLSGFLITTLLHDEWRRKGYVHVGKFWGRRFLRLMPAYWLYIGPLTLWMLLHPHELSEDGGWSPAQYMTSLWLYFVNYLPMGGIWTNQYLTVHLWSLAMEEQFYLLWPLAMYFAFRLRRPWVVAWGALVAVLVRRGFTPTEQMGSTLSIRGIGIVLGCTTALTLATTRRPAWLESVRLRSAVAALSLFAIAVLTVVLRRGLLTEADIKSWFITWICVLFALFIAMLWYGPADRFTRLMSSRPMKYLGQISYGMYLFHIPTQVLVWKVLLSGIETWNKWPKYTLRFAAFVALTVAFASLSHRFIERRFLLLKDRMR